MKKLCLAILVSGLLLTLVACSPEEVDSSSFSSSSSAASESSSIVQSSSSQPDDSGQNVSYDMDAWEWREHSFEGYTISLPSSCSIQGDKIYVNEEQLPESIVHANFYPTGMGWLRKGLTLDGNNLTKVNDTTYHLTLLEGSDRDMVMSDDPTLPDSTFYQFEDYLAFTYIGGVGGDGSRESMIKSTVYIPMNRQGLGITFYAEADSTEGKPLFEKIMKSIKVGENANTQAEVIQPEHRRFQAEGKSAYIVNADGGLNMRAGPGTEYESLMLIPDGELLTPIGGLEAGSDWEYVSYSGVEGWINRQYAPLAGV